jgi:hypothetical protein
MDLEDEATTVFLDRPTLPNSAPPAPLEDQRPTLPDPSCVPPAPEEAQAPWWRRVGLWLRQRLHPVPVAPDLPPLPPPFPPGTLLSQESFVRLSMAEELLHLLWRFPPEHLRAVLRLGAHIVNVQALGPEAMLEAHVHFVLSRLRTDADGTISLARLRDRVVGYPRAAVDQALLRLEAQERITLFPAPGEVDVRSLAGALQHPTRGALTRCTVWVAD